MNRRAFIGTLAAVPFLGWLKPAATPKRAILSMNRLALDAQRHHGVLRTGPSIAELMRYHQSEAAKQYAACASRTPDKQT